MILTLYINGIHLILIKMSVILFWQFNILPILTKVNFDVVLSDLIEQLLDSLSLFVYDRAYVLVGFGVSKSFVSSVVSFGDWVEAVEEGFEEGIFGLLDDTQHSCSFGFVVCLHKTFSYCECILFLTILSFPSDPYNDLFIQFKNETVISVQHFDGERSLCDFSSLNFSRLIRNFPELVGLILFWLLSVSNRWIDD